MIYTAAQPASDSKGRPAGRGNGWPYVTGGKWKLPIILTPYCSEEDVSVYLGLLPTTALLGHAD